MPDAVILVNAYIRAPAMLRQAERIAEELRARGVGAEIVKNGGFPCAVRGGELFLARRPDFVVYLDKDKYLARMLEGSGVRLFNRAAAVEACDDKMLTCIALAGSGVRLPDTLPAPLCYYADAEVSEDGHISMSLAAGAVNNLAAMYDGDYQTSTDARISLGEAIEGEVVTDADVWHMDGNNIYVSLNRPVSITSGEEAARDLLEMIEQGIDRKKQLMLGYEVYPGESV